MKEHTTWLCGGESRVCVHNVLGVQDVYNDSCGSCGAEGVC